MPEQKRCFHFSYPTLVPNPRYERDPRFPGGAARVRSWERDLYRVRDASAFLEFFDVIHRAGYAFGDTILNLSWGPGDGSIPEKITAVPALRETDLLVATTRCPLDVGHPGHHGMAIRPSTTPLENQIFDTLRECFLTHCARNHVVLRGDLHACLVGLGLPAPDYHFHQIRPALLPDQRFTMGFLFYAPHLLPLALAGTKKRGPRFFQGFGITGVESWLWARALRRSHADLLSQIIGSDDFWAVLGKWELPPKTPLARPMTLAFADDMVVDLVVLTAKAGAQSGTPTTWTRV